jgi:hypothetical protein
MMKILTNAEPSDIKMRKSKRGYGGNTIAEMPSFLYFLTFAIAVPMVCAATMAMRGVFFLFACRDATNKAAKCASVLNDNTTITPNTVSAVNTAAAAFKTDMAAWTGITGTLNITIVGKSTTGKAPVGPFTTSAPTIDTTNFIYFIHGTGVGSITPLISIGKFMGLDVPGLTEPFPLTINVESYVENPTGLLN